MSKIHKWIKYFLNRRTRYRPYRIKRNLPFFISIHIQSNTLQWTTTTTTGFYNTSKTMTRMQVVIVDNGNIFIFGGFQVDSIVGSDRNGNNVNFMNVLDANTLTWS
ncbi:hypothetical protein F8M41_013487 [Gigaspora margarita]|uniref:Uncharacterized protein n=1 Tax=Gigaspora margarita TaxID=4874 RepID=A0A8H4ASH6_GIGMA|nr:hypothetical protein F8M41_013487 [Gigaspora margarita]